MIFTEASLDTRKARLAKAFKDILRPDETVVIFSGVPIPKPGGLDQTYPYFPHPEYFWLTGSRRAGGAMMFEPSTGWKHYVTPLDPSETVWEGRTESIEGNDIKELVGDLKRIPSDKIFYYGQINHPLILASSEVQSERLWEVQEVINHCRRPKDEEELDLIRRSAGIASKGFELLAGLIKEGETERSLQIAYEAEIYRHGSGLVPYDTIVGAGTNAAILHAHPSNRLVKQGDFVLVDAGAQIEDYCVDITRVFVADEKRTTQQDAMYQIVKKAQEASIAQCRPGVEWVDVHNASARCIAEGLIELGILKGQADDCMSSGAIGLFFPHGVGHMVGQRVRDVGGNPTRETAESCGAKIRVNIELKEQFVMTVEPGLYFIPTLLNDPSKRKAHKEQVHWQELEKWLPVGGVRLEDDILITSNDPVNLTGMIPK